MTEKLQLVDPQPMDTLPREGHVFLLIEYKKSHHRRGQREVYDGNGVDTAAMIAVEYCPDEEWIGCFPIAWSKTVTIVNMGSNDE